MTSTMPVLNCNNLIITIISYLHQELLTKQKHIT